MFTQNFLTVALLASACSIPAFASLQTYSSVANMESTVSGDTFSNITFAEGDLGTSTTVGGVVFSVDSPQLTGIASPSGWQSGTAITATYDSSVYTITITLPAAVNAIALNLDGQSPGFVTGISVSDGSQTLTPSFTQSGSTPGFYAVSTTATFTSFTISGDTTGSSGVLTVGDVVIGEASPTPEVATFLLVGTGLLAMGYFRRRKAGSALLRARGGVHKPLGLIA